MDDIVYDICRKERGNSFLLLGHRGCGKSTELNRMSAELEDRGYKVKTAICSLDLDLLNMAYEWIMLLGVISEEIGRKMNGKLPVVIFEDLDKLNPDSAWNIFYNYAAVLSSMPFPVIYTFPIALSYDTKFSAMESYFTIQTLPMIKIETIEGQPYKDGINVIWEVVEKRADKDLFESGVLEKLIKYTGGSLRDLFHAINTSAKRAERRKSAAISMEDADRALEYNGKRWHNVHPLVVRFLKDQGVI